MASRPRQVQRVILAFPHPSPIRLLTRPAEVLAPFTPEWCEQHLPLIDTAVDLLAVDDAEFARRCVLMRDEGGRAMLVRLAGQLQRLGVCLADVGSALGLTAARIRDSVTATA